MLVVVGRDTDIEDVVSAFETQNSGMAAVHPNRKG